MISGHTHLRTGVSGAKFDEEADFEVRSAVVPQKTTPIKQNAIVFIKKVLRKKISGVDK